MRYRKCHSKRQRQNGDHRRKINTETVTAIETTENADSVAKRHKFKKTNAQQLSLHATDVENVDTGRKCVKGTWYVKTNSDGHEQLVLVWPCRN